MGKEDLSAKWAVVHQLSLGLGQAETAVFFVTGVDPQATSQHVKDVLNNAGLFFGDGGIRWEKFFLSAEVDWIEEWVQEFTNPQKACMTYEELLARGQTDRRITLRLTPATHAGLAHAAQGRGISLNQIIVDVLDDWQERHNDVNTSGFQSEIGSQAASAAFEKVGKNFDFSVAQLAAYPIYFVELFSRQLKTGLDSSTAPKQISPPKAIVEFRDCSVLGTTLIGKEAKFVKWERPVPSGKFGDAELRLALEEAVWRFERGEI